MYDDEVISDRDRDAMKVYSYCVEGAKTETNVKKIILKDRAAMALISDARKEKEREANEAKVEEVDKVIEVDKNSDDFLDVEDKKNRYFQISRSHAPY